MGFLFQIMTKTFKRLQFSEKRFLHSNTHLRHSNETTTLYSRLSAKINQEWLILIEIVDFLFKNNKKIFSEKIFGLKKKYFF